MSEHIEEAFVTEIVEEILRDPLNLATEIELREQTLCAAKAFSDCDVDGSGYLTSDELNKLCIEMGLAAESDEDALLMRIDKDESEEIDIKEWLEWWLKRVSRLPNPAKQQEVLARNVFKKFDENGNGTLDLNELTSVLQSLGAEFSDEEMEAALSELDKDGNGTLDQEEFVLWWCNRAKKNRQSNSLVAIKLKQLARKANQIYSTDIFTAVWKNDLVLVQSFVNSDKRAAIATDSTEFGNSWTPLHYAAYQGHIEIISFLLDQPLVVASTLNSRNSQGFTPLFFACQQNHVEVCKLLLDKGADPSIYGTDSTKQENEEICMCPACFATPSSDLYSIMKDNSRCTAPRALDPNKISASFTNALSLSLNFPSQKSYSSLMLGSFKISISCSKEWPVPSLDITVKAKSPNNDQVYDVPVDKKWLQKVFLAVTAAAIDCDVYLLVDITPVNCMCVIGPTTSISVNAKSAFRSFRNKSVKESSVKSVDIKADEKPTSSRLSADSKGTSLGSFKF